MVVFCISDLSAIAKNMTDDQLKLLGLNLRAAGLGRDFFQQQAQRSRACVRPRRPVISAAQRRRDAERRYQGSLVD